MCRAAGLLPAALPASHVPWRRTTTRSGQHRAAEEVLELLLGRRRIFGTAAIERQRCEGRRHVATIDATGCHGVRWAHQRSLRLVLIAAVVSRQSRNESLFGRSSGEGQLLVLRGHESAAARGLLLSFCVVFVSLWLLEHGEAVDDGTFWLSSSLSHAGREPLPLALAVAVAELAGLVLLAIGRFSCVAVSPALPSNGRQGGRLQGGHAQQLANEGVVVHFLHVVRLVGGLGAAPDHGVVTPRQPAGDAAQVRQTVLDE
mmetsp:Transcript_6166/g.14831  ORF Transcript_6166/g.14831 Transcript_6166/m.14831 type:complete len:259 (+) Transcript_6166:1839-2615(+)